MDSAARGQRHSRPTMALVCAARESSHTRQGVMSHDFTRLQGRCEALRHCRCACRNSLTNSFECGLLPRVRANAVDGALDLPVRRPARASAWRTARPRSSWQVCALEETFFAPFALHDVSEHAFVYSPACDSRWLSAVDCGRACLDGGVDDLPRTSISVREASLGPTHSTPCVRISPASPSMARLTIFALALPRFEFAMSSRARKTGCGLSLPRSLDACRDRCPWGTLRAEIRNDGAVDSRAISWTNDPLAGDGEASPRDIDPGVRASGGRFRASRAASWLRRDLLRLHDEASWSKDDDSVVFQCFFLVVAARLSFISVSKTKTPDQRVGSCFVGSKPRQHPTASSRRAAAHWVAQSVSDFQIH